MDYLPGGRATASASIRLTAYGISSQHEVSPIDKKLNL
jgi:hypothetical protein